MPPNDDAHVGGQMVSILVGPEKKSFIFYKQALIVMAHFLFCALLPSGTTETFSTDRHWAALPDELPDTVRAFMQWLYPAFIGISTSCLPPDSDTVALFQLYGLANRYLIEKLEDAIVSVLYEKFANTSNLWFVLGIDKLALETFVKEVPSGSHLYRLVVRSLAYSIRLRPEDAWIGPGGTHHYPNRSFTVVTESRVVEVMEIVPSDLCGPILKEVLLLKALGGWRQGFDSSVGLRMKFLKRYDDLGNSGHTTGL